MGTGARPILPWDPHPNRSVAGGGVRPRATHWTGDSRVRDSREWNRHWTSPTSGGDDQRGDLLPGSDPTPRTCFHQTLTQRQHHFCFFDHGSLGAKRSPGQAPLRDSGKLERSRWMVGPCGFFRRNNDGQRGSFPDESFWMKRTIGDGNFAGCGRCSHTSPASCRHSTHSSLARIDFPSVDAVFQPEQRLPIHP